MATSRGANGSDMNDIYDIIFIFIFLFIFKFGYNQLYQIGHEISQICDLGIHIWIRY